MHREFLTLPDGNKIPVREILNRGYEGIAYQSTSSDKLFLLELEWRNGGYFERVRELSREEFEAWKEKA